MNRTASTIIVTIVSISEDLYSTLISAFLSLGTRGVVRLRDSLLAYPEEMPGSWALPSPLHRRRSLVYVR